MCSVNPTIIFVEITVIIVCCIASLLSVCKEQSKCVDLIYQRYDVKKKVVLKVTEWSFKFCKSEMIS